MDLNSCFVFLPWRRAREGVLLNCQ